MQNFSQRLNLPRSRKNLFSIIGIALVVLMVPLTVKLAGTVTNLVSRASSDSHVVFVNPQTLQAVTTITSPQVGVLLTAPWPIASVPNKSNKGTVAGLIAQKPAPTESVHITNSKDHAATTPTPGGTETKNNTNVTTAPTNNSKTNRVDSTTSTPAESQRTVSIQLAEDQNFTQNLVTVVPSGSNPYFARYAFSNSVPGVKTLYAKFISSTGSIQVFNSSIQLVSSTLTAAPTLSTIRDHTVTNSFSAENARGAFPGAPLCPDSGAEHNNSVYHSLWDSTRGCHFDHEHGQNPLVPGVAATFPGFDLQQLTGGVSIGHTNPSSPMENTHKHGGFKWQFMPAHPQGCAGFESSTNGINGSLIQLHGFGDYAMELTGRIHSSLALLRMCNQANPEDYGYLYTVQFQDYGQIVSPYQGDTIPFPFSPSPAYDSARGPYLTVDCVGQKGPDEAGACRESREQVLSRGLNANSNWASKPSGITNITNPFGSTLFNLFFRLRDTYQLVDWNDKTYPFTFSWLCSSDNGVTFNPAGCRYNNSTIQVHEIAGKIPASWDNLSGFDTDPRVGRVTASGYTDRYGTLNRSCIRPNVSTTTDRSLDCFPVKMVNAFVGTYGSVLVFLDGKGTNLVPLMPEKDIYFCNGAVCSETDAGAVPSGWIGPKN